MGAEGAGEMTMPLPEMPVVRVIPRPILRARLVRDGWFIETDLLPDPLPNGRVLKDAGYKREGKALETLKNKGLIGYAREIVWTVRP